jgi:lipopolysaccharide export system permease protein
VIFQTIWERYFIKECLKVFFLFLFCFYGLYIIIDYASHTSALPHHDTQIYANELIKYYLMIFVSRAEILIPFALLVSVIKTLCRLNTDQELVALQAGGIGLKRLTRPFIILGMIGVGFLFLNEQIILPMAQKKLLHIESKTKHRKHLNRSDIRVQSMELPDGSKLLYQSYDPTKNHFFDVYWILSFDEIYRMRTLSPHGEVPVGNWVEHFLRDEHEDLVVVASSETLLFPKIRFNAVLLESNITDPETLPLSELIKKASINSQSVNHKDNKALVVLIWRLILPWLCLLVVIAPIPFCMRFSRQLPVFLIYVFSLFGLISFYLLMDAALVVAKRQILTPFIALGVPFGIISLIFGWRYWRMN